MEKDKKEFVIILLGGMAAVVINLVINHVILGVWKEYLLYWLYFL